jgi:hypothetical protein
LQHQPVANADLFKFEIIKNIGDFVFQGHKKLPRIVYGVAQQGG